MPKAIWNGVVIAESDETEIVEGSHYFPPDSVKSEYLTPSNMQSTCPWKGVAHYYHITVGGNVNSNAAFYYPTPRDAAADLKGRVAFWKGVKVED